MDVLFMFRAGSIFERLLNVLSTGIITGILKNNYEGTKYKNNLL